jgi:hypothetical protein
MTNHDIANRDFEDLVDKQFLGVIEAIDDPRKEGRARVRVFGIHEDLATEDLPWAYPKTKPMFFGQEGKGGSLSVPKLNSVVAVRFDNGNPYSPEYFGIHELAQDVKDELNTEYEGSHMILFDGDQELKIWFSVGKGLTISLKEANINIDPDNLITVTTSNKVVVDSPNIELGTGALEAVIKGETFQRLFNAHTHVGNLGAPTSPPVVPLTGTELSQVTKTQ